MSPKFLIDAGEIYFPRLRLTSCLHDKENGKVVPVHRCMCVRFTHCRVNRDFSVMDYRLSSIRRDESGAKLFGDSVTRRGERARERLWLPGWTVVSRLIGVWMGSGDEISLTVFAGNSKSCTSAAARATVPLLLAIDSSSFRVTRVR